MLFIIIILVLIFAVVAWILAARKNRFGFGWFLLTLLFVPLILILLALPPLKGAPAGAVREIGPPSSRSPRQPIERVPPHWDEPRKGGSRAAATGGGLADNPTGNIVAALERLNSLRQSGAITAEEFERLKRKAMERSA